MTSTIQPHNVCTKFLNEFLSLSLSQIHSIQIENDYLSQFFSSAGIMYAPHLKLISYSLVFGGGIHPVQSAVCMNLSLAWQCNLTLIYSPQMHVTLFQCIHSHCVEHDANLKESCFHELYGWFLFRDFFCVFWKSHSNFAINAFDVAFHQACFWLLWMFAFRETVSFNQNELQQAQ